jgi:hypothetical protein
LINKSVIKALKEGKSMSKTALITGSTSGIGAAYAKKFASNGYDLINTGRRQEIIQKLADDLTKQFNIGVKVIIAELSDDSDIQKVVDAIKSSENFEILVNNAGYGGAPIFFTDKDSVEHENMMKVLMTVPLRLAYAALPNMSKNRRGTVINIASGAAFIPAKKQAIYAASKAFLKSFSESLYLEVKSKGIKVQVVPGAIDTDFYRDFSSVEKNIFFKKFKIMSPESVVDSSLKDLEKNMVVSIPGAYYKNLMVLVSILPRSYWYKRIDKSIT